MRFVQHTSIAVFWIILTHFFLLIFATNRCQTEEVEDLGFQDKAAQSDTDFL